MTSDSPPPPPADFDATLRARNVASLQVAGVLVSTLVPLFWLLDWVVVPGHALTMLWLRLGCTAPAVFMLIALRRSPQWTARHVNLLSTSLSLGVAWCIAAMCWLDRGYESPYYAGMSLVILGVSFIFVWPFRLSCWFHGLVYGFYMAPLAMGLLPVREFSAALSNQFFLLGMIIVALASQRHRLSMEQREFSSKQEQKRLLDEVQALATTDWLSSLHNRRHFFALGEGELRRARRYRRPLCAIMVDIDRFKQINDTYGHSVGDEVIQTVAQRMQANCRRDDILGRYGGEEFAILLPETDFSVAHERVAERLRLAVQDEPITTSRGPLRVTLSIGVTRWNDEVDSLLELMTRADSAMYAAKRAGRNRVAPWSPECALVAAEAERAGRSTRPPAMITGDKPS